MSFSFFFFSLEDLGIFISIAEPHGRILPWRCGNGWRALSISMCPSFQCNLKTLIRTLAFTLHCIKISEIHGLRRPRSTCLLIYP